MSFEVGLEKKLKPCNGDFFAVNDCCFFKFEVIDKCGREGILRAVSLLDRCGEETPDGSIAVLIGGGGTLECSGDIFLEGERGGRILRGLSTEDESSLLDKLCVSDTLLI